MAAMTASILNLRKDPSETASRHPAKSVKSGGVSAHMLLSIDRPPLGWCTPLTKRRQPEKSGSRAGLSGGMQPPSYRAKVASKEQKTNKIKAHKDRARIDRARRWGVRALG